MESEFLIDFNEAYRLIHFFNIVIAGSPYHPVKDVVIFKGSWAGIWMIVGFVSGTLEA
jgi:hypothetical protein